jgi:hypothetical protein
MLKLPCSHIGNSKKFFYSTKTEDDSSVPAVSIECLLKQKTYFFNYLSVFIECLLNQSL